MKRTSKHTPQNYLSRLEVRFTGKDQRGTMKRITQFLADRSLDLAAVRSFSEELDNGEQTQTISLTINIPEKVELEKLEKSIYQLSEEMALDCTIRRMEGTTSRNDRG